MESRIVSAKIEQWNTIVEMLDFCLSFSDCSEQDKNEIYISAEEIFTNIASYAYEEGVEGMAEISCGIKEKKRFWISFKDWGKPYNPLNRPEPDFNIPFEQRRIGGLGIYMVKKFMDEVTYRYEKGCNILTLTKKI